ncbi:MAG TPA: hypothetical protein VGL56_16810 [Fimbriimonadaceae bacterium]|jgi:hypothetical protein
MSEATEIWKQALPVIRSNVTGVGVWAALNSAVPIAIEDNTFVIGLAPKDGDLAGHLRMAQTKRFIDLELTRVAGKQTIGRVIDGTTFADWERVKRRDLEAQRLKDIAESKTRAEISSRSGWDGVYEQLSRRYAAIQNKSLPQNRAKFLREVIDLVAEALKAQQSTDEMGERNLGRCIERISQYSDVPSTLVAVMVLEKAGAN